MKKHNKAYNITINYFVNNGDNCKYDLRENHSHHHGTALRIVLWIVLGIVLIAAVLLVAHYIRSNQKLILDIQRTARKNMISYQKTVADILNSNQLIVAQSAVKSTLNDLLKKFKYYRLSLYSYALASFLEIMLSKNFKEEYVAEIKSEIEKQSFDYRELYDKCSIHLEKMTTSSIETNVMKGIGNASRAVGGFLGGISFLKGSVDNYLKDSGDSLTKNANEIEAGTVAQFKEVSSPNTKVFVDRMDDIIQIYNHTEVIYFDQNLIYLVAG